MIGRLLSDLLAVYLITGAAGFIGSSLAHALVAAGETVRGFDNFSTGRRENLTGLLDRMEFFEADLVDADAMQQACQGVDFVLHHAAVPWVQQSVVDPASTNRVNVEGTINLLLAARDAGVKRPVFAASCAAHGDSPESPKREDMVPATVSPYAACKVAGEQYVHASYRVCGLETMCLRYFNVFGPRQNASSPYSGVVALFISKILVGERPTIFGDGEQSSDFIYVDDVVRANLLACSAPAQRQVMPLQILRLLSSGWDSLGPTASRMVWRERWNGTGSSSQKASPAGNAVILASAFWGNLQQNDGSM